ncbi:glycosyltransferase family 4 protein [Fusobacteria bacterium ZRK30]|nr:glycosyltransferase family 4 protein [Fusobacteria bacterium ZRK30]
MYYNYLIQLPVMIKDNEIYMEKLPAIDINLHIDLLPKGVKLRLIAPLVLDLTGDYIQLNENMEFIPLEYENSFIEGFRVYRKNKKIINTALSEGGILHTGGGGYPYMISSCYTGIRDSQKYDIKKLFIMDCDLVGKLKTDQVERSKNILKKIFWTGFMHYSKYLYEKSIGIGDTAFMLGEGVYQKYSKFSKNPFKIYQPIVGEDQIIEESVLDKKLNSIGADIGKIKFFYIGRLAYEKGLDTLIKGFMGIPKEKYEINIIGDGDEMDRLKCLSKDLDIQVNFFGWIPWGEQLFSIISKQHIIIIPHRTEEMTRTVFDSMAQGVGFITTKTIALCDVISKVKNGITFSIDDDEELNKHIKRIIGDTDLIKKWSLNSFNYIKQHNSRSYILERIEKLEKDGFFEM